MPVILTDCRHQPGRQKLCFSDMMLDHRENSIQIKYSEAKIAATKKLGKVTLFPNSNLANRQLKAT